MIINEYIIYLLINRMKYIPFVIISLFITKLVDSFYFQQSLIAGDVGLTAKETLQQTLNGLMEQNKLPYPTTIIPCIDEDTALIIVNSIQQLLVKLSNLTFVAFGNVTSQIEKLQDRIPPSVIECLFDDEEGINQQIKQILSVYGINKETTKQQAETQFKKYATLHGLTYQKREQQIYSKWKVSRYFEAGYLTALYSHDIFI